MTTGVIEPGAAAPPPPKKNVFARFAGVLFAPADTFEEIARRPDVLAPLLLLIVIGFGTTSLLAPRLDYDTIRAMQAEQMHKRNPSMSQADLERFGRMGMAGVKVFLWLAPVISIVFYAVAAGVLLLAFRMMGGEGTYKQSFSATIYAWLPFTLYSIVLAVVVLARGTFEPTTAATIVKSNPAFLVEMREQPALYSLLSALDLFSIWALILFTFGFAAMSRLSRKTSAAIVVILWAVFVLVRAGMASFQA